MLLKLDCFEKCLILLIFSRVALDSNVKWMLIPPDEWLEVPCFFTSLTFISWDSFCFVRCNSGNLLLKNSGSIAKKFKRPYKSSGYFMFRSIFMCTYESYQKFKNPGKRTINFDLLAIIFTSDMYEMKAPSPIPTQNISSVLVL